MNFTGYSYRNLLDQKTNNFLFENLSIGESSYPHKIIFSGEGKKFEFTFSGHRMLDDSNNFFWSFNSGELLDLEVKFNQSIFSYYVNSNLIADGYRDNFELQKLIIDTSGLGISFDPKFFSEGIDLSAKMVAPSFSSGENVNFRVENLSSAKLKIYSTEFNNLFEGSPDISFEKNQTGVISGYQILNFTSKDLTENLLDYKNFLFTTLLKTNAGDFVKTGVLNRFTSRALSYLNYDYNQEMLIDHFFSGETGLNSFVFKRSEKSRDALVRMVKLNGNLKTLETTGFLEFQLTGFSGFNTGLFITGINITHSGVYEKVPEVIFNSFSGVKYISVNQKNLISYDTGDSFDLMFSGNGTGLSARAFTKTQLIQLFTGQNSSSKFRTITGVSVVSAGSGFNNGKYLAYMPSSIVDYPRDYEDSIASSIGYSPVKFSTDFLITAGFASGRAVLGHTTGSNFVSKILLIAPGSGYDSSMQFPIVSFKRAEGDIYANTGRNVATGVCLLNSLGEHTNFNNWTVLAGRNSSGSDSSYDLELNTSSGKFYFGPIVFDANNPDLNIRIKSSNSKVYDPNGLRFHIYETGDAGKYFSVFSRNNYFIPGDFGGSGSLFVDIYESEG